MKKSNNDPDNFRSPFLEEIVSDLCDSDTPLIHSKLANLSNMNSVELRIWEQSWKKALPERRRKIVSQLVELAEDNIELNFEKVFRNCLHNTDAQVRSKAIDGLWENEDSSLITTLIELIENDKSEQVQKTALIGLGKFALLAEHNKLQSKHKDNIGKALHNIIKNKDKPQEVRFQALAAAAPLSYTWVTEAIHEAYLNNDRRSRNTAIFAMGKNCNRSWLPILLKELNSENTETRYEAVIACGAIGEEEAIPKLIKLTQHQDVEVSLAAIKALGEIGGFKAKNHLQYSIKNPNKVIQQAAEQALQELTVLEDPLSMKPEADL